MLDLYNKKYDRETLKTYIYMLNLVDVIKTQTIDATFAVRYILNKKYQLLEEEENITYSLILKYQTQISKDNLKVAILNYDSEDDSVTDFENVSNT